ncbi:MAG: zinc-dependent metalloprotease [Bacteroidota bacterium]
MKNQLITAMVSVMLFCTLYVHSQNVCLTKETNVQSDAEHAFNEYVVAFKARNGHLNTDLKIIPVVIHVIYRNAADSMQIDMARVHSQIEATNKQLRRLNANAVETRPMFLPVAADCDINVCLATKKPDRTGFSGVLYHYYPDFELFRDLSVVKANTIIDPDKYLNVWIIPDNDEGAAVFPWGKSQSDDGFWVGAKCFGTMGSNLSTFLNMGETFTHELAHYLGVYHTFHNSSGYAFRCEFVHDGSIGDLCADTPLDWEWPASTIQCNDGVRICIETPGVEFIITQSENYMFYNQDSCRNMFSKDQRIRMRACLSDLRAELVSASNLIYTGVECNGRHNDDDLGNHIFVFPNPTSDIVHFAYVGLTVDNMTIKVYNQSGWKLKEVHSNREIKQISLGSLPRGVYYLNMTVGSASVTKHVLKN